MDEKRSNIYMNALFMAWLDRWQIDRLKYVSGWRPVNNISFLCICLSVWMCNSHNRPHSLRMKKKNISMIVPKDHFLCFIRNLLLSVYVSLPFLPLIWFNASSFFSLPVIFSFIVFPPFFTVFLIIIHIIIIIMMILLK